MRQFLSSIFEVFEIALVAIGAVFLIRTFLIQPFLVSGSSMIPNFSNGDYLLIDELTYHFRSPQRGEVIVFRYPKDESTYFIKRIVALPGERVEIKNDKVKIYDSLSSQGFVLGEKYLPDSIATGGNSEYNLGAGEYLVLGDNRSYSFDSRSWGLLKEKEIVGLVRLRLWPFDALRAFAAPRY